MTLRRALIVEWAKAARLVRVVKGRLVPISKSAGLLGRPAELWTVLLSTFDGLNPVFLPTGWGSSLLRAEFSTAAGAILSALCDAAGPIQREQLRALAWDTVTALFILDDATPTQLQTARTVFGRDVDRVLTVLARLGALTLTDTTAELTPPGRDASRRARGEPAPGEPILQVTVRLLDVAPPVWRRLLVPSATPLDRLHDIIQAAMGWENSHLHSFTDGKQTYGRPDPELGFLDETTTRLGEVNADRLGYTYDFGDDWEHEIVVEAVVEAEASGTTPAASTVAAPARRRTAAVHPATRTSARPWPSPNTPTTPTCWTGWAWTRQPTSTPRPSPSSRPTRGCDHSAAADDHNPATARIRPGGVAHYR